MRQIGHRPLWIGNAGDLQNPRAFHDCGIEAIVELADNEPFASLSRDLIRIRIPLSDGGENEESRIELAVHNVAELIRAGILTAVCCGYGANRSVCITAAAIASVEAMSIDDALKLVAASGPVDVAPGLWLQVRKCVLGSR